MHVCMHKIKRFYYFTYEARSGNVPLINATDFEKYLYEVLEEIRNKIPRVFVNIVELFNISMVCLTLIMT